MAAAGKWLSVRAWSRRHVGLVIQVEQRFRDDRALIMAAALSYTSLLSLVPLLAIALAILAAFPAFEGVRGELQSTLLQYLVPEVGEQLRRVIANFIGNAGKLTAVGVLGLAVTAVLLLVTIEDALNHIFRVSRPRSPLSRLLVYWTVITLGPLLLGASLSLSAWVFAADGWAMRHGLAAMAGAVSALFPLVLLTALFSLLYSAVPNRAVRMADAATGGAVAAIAMAVLRWGFHLYVTSAHAYESVYGALAVVPLLLFWMYLAWAAVLAGAELTAALPEWRAAPPPGHPNPSLLRTS